MSKKFRLDRKFDFQNMVYTKCINVIIDSIGPSIILRSILWKMKHLLQKSKCSIFHNILKCMIFQMHYDGVKG